jgi:L-rhamnose mutarotase
MAPTPAMTPVCFRLSVRPELVHEYRERHAAVWPEMLRALAETGWHEYRIFVADDGTCIGTFRTRDLDASLAGMASREVNARWQAQMRPFFAGLERPADESFELLPLAFDLDAQLAAAEEQDTDPDTDTAPDSRS